MVCFAALTFAVGGKAQCVGDCDGNGRVSVSELILGVNIALNLRSLDDCPSFDRNANGRVDINELLAAVAESLDSCPTPPATNTPAPSDTPTSTATATPSETPTITPDPPLVVEVLPIYRTFPGFDVRLPLPVHDPGERALHCEVSDLPEGAEFDSGSRTLHWTPAEDQLGPFYVPFTCENDAPTPRSAAGELIFRVTPLDACSIPTCDPASGCTVELVSPTVNCCAGVPTVRVFEPIAGCPQGRVLYAGRNIFGSFGRLQNCDLLWMRVQLQSGANVSPNVETRCMNTSTPVRVSGRIDSVRGLLFDITNPSIFLQRRSDGFDQRLAVFFPFGVSGPFFDLENQEANLHLTITDSNNVSVSESVRVILTSTRPPELPEADSTSMPTPPAPTATPTPETE